MTVTAEVDLYDDVDSAKRDRAIIEQLFMLPQEPPAMGPAGRTLGFRDLNRRRNEVLRRLKPAIFWHAFEHWYALGRETLHSATPFLVFLLGNYRVHE